MDKNRHGRMFVYRNRRIGYSRYLTITDARDIPPGKFSDNNITVYCHRCDDFMDFIRGPRNVVDGKWVCQSCRASVRELTPLRHLVKELEYIENLPSGQDDSDGMDE